MIIHHCAGCQCHYDPHAYQHHFEHDHCDHHNETPLPLILCDRHRHQCPLENTDLRHRQYGKEWPTRPPTRTCSPLYVLHGGYARLAGQPDTHREPHTWLALGTGAQPERPRPQAPRLPTLQGARP